MSSSARDPVDGAGREVEGAPGPTTSSFSTASPDVPSSIFARPDWTYHDSSFTRWNCRLSDSPARTNRTLPT